MRDLLAILLGVILAGTTFASVSYPPDAGIINIKTEYGAVGDGVADDTAAIQQAVNANAGHLRILYFPNGTYRISDSIVFPNDKFFITFQGESEEGVIIRLDDTAAGFGWLSQPKPMFRTATSPKDWTNDAFMNNFYDMTLDVGANNQGAVGILYIANNQGSIRNVTIRSSDATLRGYAAIDMSLFAIPGPCLLQHVTIIGFDYGIRLDHAQYSATAEHIHLSGQRVAGIRNRHNLLNLRGITAEYERPDVPVILNATVPENQQQGMIVLIDSFFTNSVAGSVAAIQNHGDLFARNVTTHGFSHALDEHGESVPGDVIEEYVTGGPVSLFSGASTSLGLPIEETPEVPWDDPSTWINVLDHGVTPGNGQDDAPGVQAAIDAATAENRTLYFPRGHGPYQFAQTIVVRGYVQRIVGMQADFMYLGAFANQEAPLFRLVDGTPEQEAAKEGLVVLDQLWFPWTEHVARKPTFIVNERSGRTLVRNSFFSHGRLYDGSLASGKTFFDDVIVSVQPAGDLNQPLPGMIIGPNERFWGRQLNPETRGGQVRNDGGDFWVLGFKTEQYDSDFKTAPHVHTRDGGRTEMLGAFIHAMHAGNGGVDSDAPPVFIVENAQASITAMENANNDQAYPLIVRETRGGVTRTLSLLQSPANGSSASQNLSFKLPLYIGYSGSGNQAPLLNLISPAGGHANIRSPRLALMAEADDDGVPGPLTVSWTQVSGPPGVVFVNSHSASTDATFPEDGSYVLRLTADDGELSRSVEVRVTVDSAPPALPLNGLILRYDLDETGGTHVPDTSGLGNHGAIVNLTHGQWLPGGGVIDGAYHVKTPPAWNQVHGRIEVSTNLPPTVQQTITAWVRQEFDSERPTMDVAHINGLDFYFNHEHRQVGVRAYFQEETVEGNGNVSTRGHSGSHSLPPKGSWMHLAVTFDGANTDNIPKFYLNGEELTLSSQVMGGTGGYPYMTKHASCVGARSRYLMQGMHDGAIDQFLVYDRVLDAEEIRRVYESNLGNFAPVVDAGPDLETETGETIALQGSVEDDGLPSNPGALTITWSKLNGPAGPTWENLSSPTTQVTFVNAGVYTFRLEAFDGALTSYDTVTVTVTGDNIQYPPTAHNVTASGTLQVGQTLSLSYDYEDANDAPEDTSPSGTSFRWLRSEDPNGTYSVIAGATATQYTLVSADYGHYLRAEVTPRALEEPYTGDPVLSPPIGPVLHATGSTLPVTDGLIAFWPFDDRVSPTADWSPQQYHASLVAGASFHPTGRHGSALAPGTDGGTTASHLAAPTQDFTFTAWVRHHAYGAEANEIIVGKDWNTFAFYMATGVNNGQLRIQFKDSGGTQYSANYNNARDFIPAGQWVHLAGVRDGTEFRLYVDGVLRTPNFTTGAGSQPVHVNATLTRTGHMVGAARWDGLLDQVALYNRALSSADIISVMLFDPGEYTPPDDPSDVLPMATNVLIIGTPQVGQTLSVDYDYAHANDVPEDTSPSGTSFRWLRSAELSGAYSAIDGATSATYTLVTADKNHYVRAEVTPRAQEEPYTGSPALSPPVGPAQPDISDASLPVTDGLIAFWPFDDQASPTADWSTNQFHATLASSASFNTAGQYGSALAPGANEGATASHLAAPAHNFTFTAWVCHNAYGASGNEIIVGKDWNTFAFYVDIGTQNGQLRIQFKESDGTQYNANYNDARDFIPAGQWVHLAAVREGAEFRLYVNGALRTVSWTSGAGTAPVHANTNPTRIGHMANAAHWDGLLDQVGLYNRVLSEEEIEAIMLFDASEQVPVETSYARWAATVFAHLEGGTAHPDADPLADPDGDGIPNLLEHALGGDPFQPHTAPRPEAVWFEWEDETYWLYVVTRNPDATDLTYTTEFATGVMENDWTAEGAVIVTDTPDRLEVRDPIPARLLHQRYVRLRISL